jgi:esterase/lipase superfamily enzyme
MRRLVPIFAVLVALAGCGDRTAMRLAEPPNLYSRGENYPVDEIPRPFRTVAPEMLYVTDRRPRADAQGAVTGYGTARSDSVALGAARVRFGTAEGWPALVRRTHADEGKPITRLEVGPPRELVRLPGTPLPFARRGDRLRVLPQARAAHDAATREMQAEVAARLRATGQSSVLVYIHGVNTEFNDGVATLANLWHYAGRQGVPVALTWPASDTGLLKYFRDVTTGDFSVFHVKQTLRALAGVQGLERIDIIAHSRGSAIMTTALRELLIAARAAGRDPRAAMKTGTLIMAAPDLDIGVARQRLIAERFAEAFDQINIYANETDRVLNLSRLVRAAALLGQLDATDFEDSDIASLTRAGNVHFIKVARAGRGLGHAYFRNNPAVMSDIALTLRSRAPPGSEFRPLAAETGNIWRLAPGYPAGPLPEVLDDRIGTAPRFGGASR